MSIIEESSHDKPLYRLRHPLSHVATRTVQQLYPGTLRSFGPPIDDGFYHDLIFPDLVIVSDKGLSPIEVSRHVKQLEHQACQ